MTDPTLRPATPGEIADSLAFALRYEGRKRVSHADEMMARITADRLVRHLEGSGFVLMKQPAGRAPSALRRPPPDGQTLPGGQSPPDGQSLPGGQPPPDEPG